MRTKIIKKDKLKKNIKNKIKILTSIKNIYKIILINNNKAIIKRTIIINNITRISNIETQKWLIINKSNPFKVRKIKMINKILMMILTIKVKFNMVSKWMIDKIRECQKILVDKIIIMTVGNRVIINMIKEIIINISMNIKMKTIWLLILEMDIIKKIITIETDITIKIKIFKVNIKSMKIHRIIIKGKNMKVIIKIDNIMKRKILIIRIINTIKPTNTLEMNIKMIVAIWEKESKKIGKKNKITIKIIKKVIIMIKIINNTTK